MNLDQMRDDLLAERNRIDAILKVMDGGTPARQPQSVVAVGTKKRRLSQAAKNRIAKAQRARWAKIKSKKAA